MQTTNLAHLCFIFVAPYLSPPISRANFPLHAANSICNSTVAPNTNRIVDTSFLLSNECTLQAEISRDLRDLCSQGLLLPWLAGYNECKSPYENYEKGFLRCSIRSTGKDVLNNFERRIYIYIYMTLFNEGNIIYWLPSSLQYGPP